VVETYLTFCGVAIENCQNFQTSLLEYKKNQESLEDNNRTKKLKGQTAVISLAIIFQNWLVPKCFPWTTTFSLEKLRPSECCHPTFPAALGAGQVTLPGANVSGQVSCLSAVIAATFSADTLPAAIVSGQVSCLVM
jgi:hypothetical protein